MSDPRPVRVARRALSPRPLLLLATALVLVALPLYVDAFWLQAGALCMAATVGALGLNLLTGTAGQLSLAHSFFLGVGAYGYCWFAGSGDEAGSAGVRLSGLGLPPLLAAVLAVAVAGVAGLLFSPVSARLHGLYLGTASLSLVFLGQHLLFNLSSVTGGFNGRDVPELSVFGFQLTGSEPELVLLGVPLGDPERTWYLALAVCAGAYLFARGVTRGRPGRALRLVRDSQIAAAAMGVPVRRYQAAAFVVSSFYAGAAGVLLALVLQRVVPDYFGLVLAVDYLVMVVVGGLGSVSGTVLGACFVTALPLLLSRYGDSLGLAQPGSGGLDAAVGSRLLFGVVVVVVVLLSPSGLARLLTRPPRRAPDAPAGRNDTSDHPAGEPVPAASTTQP